MIAGINYVLIEPDPDNTDLHGVRMSGEFDQERMWSVYGTVKALPSKLWFHPLTGNLEIDRWITDKSLEWETDMELKIGDRVIFRYNAWMDEEGLSTSGMMVKYDAIYAKLDPVTPLNGYVFVDDEGNVKYKGGLNKRYLHYPEREDGEIGTKIYPVRRSVRMEADEFAKMGLRRMQRKEILCYER
jgi:hypothetical protein